MACIACVLDSMFEDDEFKRPYDAFREAGHQVDVIGLQAGTELKGYRGQVTVRTDKGITEVRPDDCDALFIPGGYSPDHLRVNPSMVAYTREMVRSGKPVLAICHGPQLLLTADVVRGRRMTAWTTIQEDLRKVGADVVDEEVVVDGNLVTSRKPDDIPAFIKASLKLLEQHERTGAAVR
jgi:protease I